MDKKRTRIDDIVQLTGLSRSTVDRVLNNRPSVSLKAKTRVENALVTLGYAPDALSSRKIRPIKRVHVLLSQGTNPFFARLTAGFEQIQATDPFQDIHIEMCGFDPYDPKTVVQCLDNVPSGTNSVVTVGVDTPTVEQAINTLEQRNVRVITCVSDVPHSARTAYVGQDNFTAGKTAGRMMANMIGSNSAKIAILLGHLQFRHLLDRQSGFQQVVGLDHPDWTLLTPKPYGTDAGMARAVLHDLMAEHPDLKGIYLAGGGQPHLIDALAEICKTAPVIIGHELNPASRAALHAGTFKLILAHDPVEIARKSLEAAIAEKPPNVIPCGVNIYVAENLPVF